MSFGIDDTFTEEPKEGIKPLEAKPLEGIKQPEKPEENLVEPQNKTELQKGETPKDVITDDKELKESKPISITDDQVSDYLKSKYLKDKEFSSLEELFAPQEPTIKEVEKEVNPWEDVLDDEDKAYLTYKRETGRSRKEFDFLQKDISNLSPLELARDKIRNETGLKLSKSEADEYLEKKLGIELSDELSVNDKIELNAFVKPYKDTLLEQQEKYKKPLDEVLKNKQKQLPKVDTVLLPNGETMPKAEYEQKMVDDRNRYIKEMTKAVDSVTAFDFKIPIDDNGEKSELDFSYELSKDDKHSMLSDALDLDATIEKRFNTKDGFNHQELSKTLFRGDEKNFNKIITAISEKVRAATIEEMTARDNNENFQRPPLQKVPTNKEGYGELPIGRDKPGGFGVKI